MFQKIKQSFLPIIISLSALSVSASAAFYSVSGLSKLFAGAAFEVTIMAGSLEVAKLVIASLLYQYWDTLNRYLRTYLTVAAVVLVLITSMGIYGFLSAAYQDTYRQLTVKENQVAFLDQKKQFYEKDVARYDEELERISNNISTLSNAKATSIQVRDTTSSTGLRSSVSTAELRLSQQRIEVEEENRKSVQVKREQVADSLQKYQLEILDLENNADVAGELGPLQYLSKLTNTSMDKIINYLLLIIIFVFDPLAISLVVAANFAFEHAYPKKKYRENLYGEQVEDDLSVWDTTLQDGLDNISYNEDQVETDSVDMEHKEIEEVNPEKEWEIKVEENDKFEDEEFNILDLDKDGVISEEEIKAAKTLLAHLQNQLATQSISGWRMNKLKTQIKTLEQQINNSENDITKIY